MTGRAANPIVHTRLLNMLVCEIFSNETIHSSVVK